MVQLHLGVLLLGVSGIFAKLIHLPALDIIAYRSVFTAVALGAFLVYSKQTLKLRSKRDYVVAVVLGVLAAVHWWTYFLSIQKTSVAIGMLSLFTYPVMIVLLEPLVRRSLPKLSDIGISLVVLFGISLLFPNLWQTDVGLSPDFTFGVVIGLFSALCFALRNIGIQHYFKGYSGTQNMFYQFGIAALLFIPFADTQFIELDLRTIELLVLFAIFFSAMAHVLFSNAIGTTGAKTAGLVACLQPLYGIVLSLIILAEVPSWTTLVGGSIILAAAIYETTYAGRKTDK